MQAAAVVSTGWGWVSRREAGVRGLRDQGPWRHLLRKGWEGVLLDLPADLRGRGQEVGARDLFQKRGSSGKVEPWLRRVSVLGRRPQSRGEGWVTVPGSPVGEHQWGWETRLAGVGL